jgi:lysophospholipase L1-like esterase
MGSARLSLGPRVRVLSVLAAALLCGAAADEPAARLPRVYLIGDSTVKNGTRGQQGWGDPLAGLFDPSRAVVENRARGGRSSRTYLTEGLWDKVVAGLRGGDFVLMQFGHNDGGPLTGGRARASLKGNGEETREVEDPQTKKSEVVHTYGWYLRKYIADARSKGATPVVLSPVPRNIWRDGRVARASNDYGRWAVEAARQGGALFIDLNDVVAKRYEQVGPEVVKAEYFGTDHTHTTPAGAVVTARLLADALRGLGGCTLRDFLKPAESAPAPEDTEPGPSGGRVYRFDFGPGKVEPGTTKVVPGMAYSRERGFGFDLGSAVTGVDRGGTDALRGDFCTSERPFFFSVALPEGNYNVTVTLGDPTDPTVTTVKAESRRLMLEAVRTEPGGFATRTFTVNVRTPKIPSGGEVRLKDRERGVLHWDEKLTLEFNDARPCVGALEVAPADDAVTVFLVGDSTVTDQTREPWNSWGQMLPRFFKPGVAVANHAESGESLKSSAGARRFDKVLSALRRGDYLLVQFGHNDQKQRGPGVGAFTTYKADLEKLVADARARGGIPVLVTPVNRKTFDDAGKVVNSLGDYPEAVRQVAREQGVPLIDLHAMSRSLYEALGPTGAARAFVDGTHHNNYGSYELARCVVEGIRRLPLDLARSLADDVPPFDPSRPDPPDSFRVPASPDRTATAPEGN